MHEINKITVGIQNILAENVSCINLILRESFIFSKIIVQIDETNAYCNPKLIYPIFYI